MSDAVTARDLWTFSREIGRLRSQLEIERNRRGGMMRCLPGRRTVERAPLSRLFSLLAACALLSACAGGVIPPARAPVPAPAVRPRAPPPVKSPPPSAAASPAGTALTAGLAPGPAVAELVRQNARTAAALAASPHLLSLAAPPHGPVRADRGPGLVAGLRRCLKLAYRNRSRFLRPLFRDRPGRCWHRLRHRLL